MARWTEEQERWMGRGDRYGEDQRRFREERGEEGGWRERDWRDEGPERWRGGERGEWREPGRGRFMQGEGEWGRGYRGQGRREEGYERWRAEPRSRDWPRGEGAGGMDPYSGGRGGMYGGGEYGEYSTYGTSGGGWGYGRGEGRRDYERDYRRYGGEERGSREGLGEKLREGMRKLTGRGPKGYRRSDERIRDEVSEQIARSWVNAENVEVKVEKGEVTLTGFVERREDKRMLEDIAEDVYGVDEVHNNLRVQRGGQAGMTSGTGMTAGTGTTGTGAAMSAQQQPAGRTGGSRPHQPGRH